MLAKESEGVRQMTHNNSKSCPKMYECQRIRMTPTIRALLRCTADEAMQSICTNCDERPVAQEVAQERTVLPRKKQRVPVTQQQ